MPKRTSHTTSRPKEVPLDGGLSPPEVARAKALLTSGISHMDEARYNEAWEELSGALDLMEKVDAGPEEIIPVLTTISMFFVLKGDGDKSEDFGLRAMDLITKPGVSVLAKGDAIAAYGLALLVKGNRDKAITYLERALTLYETAKSKNGIVRVSGNLAIAYQAKSNFWKADAYFNRAIKMAEEIGKKKFLYKNRHNLAMNKMFQGFYKEAMTEFEHLLMEKGNDDQNVIGFSHLNIALLLGKLGRHREALERVKMGMDVAERIGSMRMLAHAVLNRVEALVEDGQVEEADRLLQERYKWLLGLKVDEVVARALRARGITNREKGNLKKAMDDFKVAERIYISSANEVYLPGVYIEWAKAAKMLKDDVLMRELVERTRAIFQKYKLKERENELDGIVSMTEK